MGRVKQNKKSTFIDMTAMSDVTVLLLTFFMLTSTFLAKEPYKANTPPSISEEEMPKSNVVEILVNPEGKVWLTVNVADTAESNLLRRSMLKHMTQIYNSQRNKEVEFSKKDIAEFVKQSAFGVPFEQMPSFLKLPFDEQDAWINGNEPGKPSGIPVSELDEQRKQKIKESNNTAGLTEFQMWILAATRAANEVYEARKDEQKEEPSLMQNIKDGTGFALKADADSPFKTVHMIMDNMQTISRNKFLLVTALKQPSEQ